MTSPIDDRAGGSELRIGDQERDQAVEELREQYALGRLDEQEFRQRLETAFAARTASELRRLVADLPSATAPVDWRPGDRRDDPQAPEWQAPEWQPWWGRGPYGDGHPIRHGYGRAYRFGHRSGQLSGPYRWAGAAGRGGGRYPYHRMPALVFLLPIMGLLFFGAWALLFLLPMVLGALVFSTVRRARFR